nr:putative pentatricopeptide repeat-containing protein [Quercus suber]
MAKVGMQVHSLVIKCGLGFDNFVVTALINLYAKCGELGYACLAFLEVEVDKPQLQAWTALMGGCAQQGKAKKAIDIFHKFHSLDKKTWMENRLTTGHMRLLVMVSKSLNGNDHDLGCT